MKTLALLTAAGLVLLPAPKPPVHWMLRGDIKPVRPGAPFTAVVVGQIDPGWHVYALEEPDGGPIATQVSLTEGDTADLEQVNESKPRVVPDPAFGVSTGYFEGSAAFTLRLRASRTATPGAHTLHAQIRYQSCSGQMCLPPRTETVEIPFTVK